MLRLWLLGILFALAGCIHQLPDGRKIADEITLANGFEKKLVAGGQFVITTYQKTSSNSGPVIIYIEGDGRISQNGFILPDPTPTAPMLLRLAMSDPRENVVYMARPCQYTPKELNPACNDKQYWTDKRLSPEVIFALKQTIGKISAGRDIDLVGFSGGGGAVVLLAAQNLKVKSMLTIAANLDIEAFSNYHGALKMAGSLNPIDYTSQVAHIPQLHLAGGKDKVVPACIIKSFVQKVDTPCANYLALPNVAHNQGWQNHWSNIINTPFCSKK